MLRIFLISILFLLIGLSRSGKAIEQFDPDSLEEKLSTTTNIDEKIEILIKLAEYYAWKDMNKTKDYADQPYRQRNRNIGFQFASVLASDCQSTRYIR